MGEGKIMDHSIKKKPEKPRMRQLPSGMWYCWSKGASFFSPSGREAFFFWKLDRAALNKHEGK